MIKMTAEEISLLCSMKWLKFSEALIYGRFSKNTLMNLISAGEISPNFEEFGGEPTLVLADEGFGISNRKY